MRHLKENNVTYFSHMKLAFTMARYGFKIAFFGVVHGIAPCVFHHDIRITINKAHTELHKAIFERSVNLYNGEKQDD